MNDEQWKRFSKTSGEDLDSYMYHNLLDIFGEVVGCSDREADIIVGKLRKLHISVEWKINE